MIYDLNYYLKLLFLILIHRKVIEINTELLATMAGGAADC